ncbi:ABC transporter ATP-binding protein [Acidimangrovimonas sediminis]|uniref:ABC transporter ATP-binding protein n=1 Tax=Acidimangrovimonas sediminis TaxID=2056283 RepID=UPI000C808DCC|nr:ABC transporter ATP-binding protein [Acidimangrovimonas sediminis]
MSSLSLRSLVKRYDETEVVKSVSLEVAEGEFVSLLGPSGCGKTTILRMVAGLLAPTSGQILIGGEDVTRLPPNRRNLGLVFQSYALFPHLTVADNVAFGLRRLGVKGAELSGRVTEALARVRLGHLGDRYPRQLSGGQQQRVALARSIAPRPGILLFDEPLSNLDAQLREEMQIELKQLQAELGLTSIFVTHDQHEAMTLSDRICLMAGGVIQQIGTPEEVYLSPATGFVADFIGSPNKLSGTMRGARVDLGGGIALTSANDTLADGTPVRVTLRQEDVAIAPIADDAGAGAIEGTIRLRLFEGASVQFLVAVAEGVELLARVAQQDPRATLAPGDRVRLSVAPERVFVAPAGAAGA